jgi:hypothetical protein
MGTPVSLIFDGPPCAWTWARDGIPVPTALRRRQSYDPRWPLLRARPHPLPRATWLDGAPTAGVLDVVPDSGHERREEWFRLEVPPGARGVRLPIVGETTAWVDGVELTHEELPNGRELLIRVHPTDGRTGGALWDGPAEFDCQEWPPAPGFHATGGGRQGGVAEGLPVDNRFIEVGPWERFGLGSYAGAVSYHRELHLHRPGTVVLDLGVVRGTAEVRVNGRAAGVRIWSPYRFELSGLVRDGVNHLTVTVRNTLGPLLDDTSPTTGVYAGQRVSGLLGPVRLLT